MPIIAYVNVHTSCLYNANIIIQVKYGYKGYRQFPLPQAQVFSRGVAEGNKHGQRAMETACIPK